MKRRTLVLNGVLALAVVGAGTGAYLSIGSPASAQASTTRTAKVSLGTVTASVSATGNTSSTSTTGVNFSSSGTLTALYVKVGSKVTKGQVLAKIDPASAQQSLTSAQAQLASAEAQLSQTETGQTAQAAERDQLNIQSAELSESNACSRLPGHELSTALFACSDPNRSQKLADRVRERFGISGDDVTCVPALGCSSVECDSGTRSSGCE